MRATDKTSPKLQELLGGLASQMTGFEPGSLRVGAIEKVIQQLLAEGWTPEELERQALGSSPQLLCHLNEAITVGETYFFRQPEHFQTLAGSILPSLGGRTLKVWSAGCATGEEAYSLAACLEAYERLSGSMGSEVLGTDLSRRHLDIAQKGDYGPWSMRGEELFPAFEDRRSVPLRVRSGLREKTRFLQHNLLHPLPSEEGPFDLIFCRNVLVYFTPAAARLALKNLASTMTPEGFLFLGATDIPFDPVDFKVHGSAGLSIYQKRSVPKLKSQPAEAAPSLGIPETLDPAQVGKKPDSKTALLGKDEPVSWHTRILEQMEGEGGREAEAQLTQLTRQFPDYLPGLYEAALWNARNHRFNQAKDHMKRILLLLEGKALKETINGPQDLTADFYLISAMTYLNREDL